VDVIKYFLLLKEKKNFSEDSHGKCLQENNFKMAGILSPSREMPS
jgi:hypothetical protein